MNVYIVSYDDSDGSAVSFHPNKKEANKRRTEVKNMFCLGNKHIDEVTIEKVSIGRGKRDFLNLFNSRGIISVELPIKDKD